MTEALCGTCLEPLPDGAAACAFCATPRPAPPGRLARLAGAASRLRAQIRGLPPRLIAAAVALLLLTTLTPLAWRLSSDGDPVPAPTAEPEDLVTEVSVLGEQLSQHPVEQLPADLRCLIADEPVVARDCALWALEAPENAFTHVVADGGVLIAGLQGGVARLDPATGAPLWHWRHPASRSPQRPASSLHLSDGFVVVVLEAEHRIVVLDAATGSEAWRMALAEGREARVAVAGRTGQPAVLVVREPTLLTGRRLHDGGELFAAPIQAGGGTPVAAGQLAVMVSGGGTVAARNLLTGEVRWRSDQHMPAESLLAPMGADVIAVARPTGEVHGLSTASGDELWRAHVPGLRHIVPLADGRLAVVTGSTVQTLLPEGGVPPATATQLAHAARGTTAGELLLAVGATVQRLSVDLQGETWSVEGRRMRGLETTAAFDGPNGPAVVTSVGPLLVAFDARPDLADTRGCAGTRQSEALGMLPAWRGERTHIALGPVEVGGKRQLWVGLPWSGPREAFTLSATKTDTGEAAGFRHFAVREPAPEPQTWLERVGVRDGARSSTGWPTHWSLYTRIGQGCWQFRVDSAEGADLVVVPVE